MLTRAHRLPRELFVSFEGGRTVHTPHFVLRFKAGVGPCARLGVSVSKKVAKKAVVRNRIRRRVYAALGGLISDLPAGLYLVSAKQGAEALKGALLETEVAEVIKKSYNR